MSGVTLYRYGFLCLIALLTLPALAADATSRDPAAFTIYAAGGRSIQTWHGQVTLQSLHFEWSRPFRWDTQLAFDVAPCLIDQPRSWFGDKYHNGNENVTAIAFGATLRKTFKPGHSVRPYAEIGTAPMLSQHLVPAATSSFNMASRGGFGVIAMGSRDVGLYIGYQFLHISNGGIAARNPGLNVNAIVIGSRIGRH
jgi:hypothetical protein